MPELVAPGLPVASVEPLLEALTAQNLPAAEKIAGSTKILHLAVAGVEVAYANAFTLLFLVTISFGGCSCIAAWFSPVIEKHYSGDVVRRLHVVGKSNTQNVGDKQDVEHKENA